METGQSLSPSLPSRSSALSQRSEALTTGSSTQREGSTLRLSSSEEVDVEIVDETADSPPQSPQYEELMEVIIVR